MFPPYLAVVLALKTFLTFAVGVLRLAAGAIPRRAKLATFEMDYLTRREKIPYYVHAPV